MFAIGFGPAAAVEVAPPDGGARGLFAKKSTPSAIRSMAPVSMLDLLIN